MISSLRFKGRVAIEKNTLTVSLTIICLILFLFCMGYSPLIFANFCENVFSKKLFQLLQFFLCSSLIFLSFTLLSAVFLGVDRLYLRRVQLSAGGSKDIFYFLRPSKFFKSAVFSVKLSFIKFIIFSACFSGNIVIAFFVYSLSKKGGSFRVNMLLIFAFFIFLINGVYFYKKLTSSLFLMRYYYVKGEYLNFSQLLASSQNSMERRGSRLELLKISFTPWFLSSLLIFPFPYVFCYYRGSLATLAYEYMKD